MAYQQGMARQVSIWCQGLLDGWSQATWFDYTFTAVWVVLIGYLVVKTSRLSTG